MALVLNYHRVGFNFDGVAIFTIITSYFGECLNGSHFVLLIF